MLTKSVSLVQYAISSATALTSLAAVASPENPNMLELAQATPQLSTLVSLAQLCDLGSFLALPRSSINVTVFAPTNAAFAKYLGSSPAPTTCTPDLKSTLVYHILGFKLLAADVPEQGELRSALTNRGKLNKIFIARKDGVVINNTSKVVAADNMTTNGIVHLVDTVLIPDSVGSVVDALAKRPQFTALTGAAVKASLAETLAKTEGITVFAPTNEAFAKLTVEPDVQTLPKILTQHVLGTRVLLANLIPGNQKVSALNGQEISINLRAGRKPTIWGPGQIELTGGFITETDIETRNGVIHAISSVLIPNLD